MILCLDVGNSRIKWGIWHDGRWQGRGAVEEPAALEPVLRETALGGAVASCVAGDQVRTRLQRSLAARGLETFWLKSAAAGHGIVNRYQQPETLGADRFAASIAGFRCGYAPCVIAGAGTALTVDALAGNGEFLGGMILPGVTLMRRSLAAGTAALAVEAGEWQPFPLATGDAVETGVWAAMSGAVAAMHARLAERSKQKVAVVVTGGDARMLAGRLPELLSGVSVAIEEYLVLEGLLWVARDLGLSGV